MLNSTITPPLDHRAPVPSRSQVKPQRPGVHDGDAAPRNRPSRITGDARAENERAENERERLNRNFAELLQEFRVAQTGVQILFAFLLTLPSTNWFAQLGPRDLVAYAVATVGAAVGTVVLVAPVSIHRAWFREGRKPELFTVASRLAQVGTFAFGVALAALVVELAGVLWYVVPASGDRHTR